MIVQLNGKYGLINIIGKEIIPLRYDRITYFSEEGFAAVSSNNKWGFIDKEGIEFIPTRYDEVHEFSEEKALVRIKSEWFYIDKKGQWLEKSTSPLQSY